MKQEQDAKSSATLAAENVGGITETEVSFTPGVTVLTGRNATNRTSLLQALMAALGSDQVSLKGNADQGYVELAVDGETYTRALSRTAGDVTLDGDPYLDPADAELAELFAFLLESNEARRAVAQSQDLRELIMRPVDTDAIQQEISELEAEKRRVDAELDELEELESKLPRLEQRRTKLSRQIEETREELDEKEANIQSADADIEETQQEQSELEARFEELRETRSDLEDVRLDIEAEEKSIDALRDESDEIETDLAEMDDLSGGDVSTIDAKIERLRKQRESVDTSINELQTIVQFNEKMLDDIGSDIADALRDETGTDGDGEEALTDQLLDDTEEVVCWTCGSDVEYQQIAGALDRLRDLRQEKLGERNSLEDEINDLEEEKRDYEKNRQQRNRLERRLDDVEAEIESRTAKLEELRRRREELQTEVEQLEATIEELEAEEHDELLDLHKEANQLEFELGSLESDLEDVEAEIESIESKLADRDELEERRDRIRRQLEELRSRIDRIEENAVTEFNEHMDEVLSILDYENLERIWIERTQKEVREGRRKVTKSSFDLHIVRKMDDGTTYEDTIDHLSESEREVTGLVFALAGYLVHDLYDTVPFIVLDSLEAIDAPRIASFMEYLDGYAEFLVVALLPEDAAELDSDYQRVTDI
jgi:chromosome segregation ATPase